MLDLATSPSSTPFHQPSMPLEAIDSSTSPVCSYIYNLVLGCTVVFREKYRSLVGPYEYQHLK